MVDIREYYEDSSSGELKPGRKGIQEDAALSYHQPFLCAIIISINFTIISVLAIILPSSSTYHHHATSYLSHIPMCVGICLSLDQWEKLKSVVPQIDDKISSLS